MSAGKRALQAQAHALLLAQQQQQAHAPAEAVADEAAAAEAAAEAQPEAQQPQVQPRVQLEAVHLPAPSLVPTVDDLIRRVGATSAAARRRGPEL